LLLPRGTCNPADDPVARRRRSSNEERGNHLLVPDVIGRTTVSGVELPGSAAALRRSGIGALRKHFLDILSFRFAQIATLLLLAQRIRVMQKAAVRGRAEPSQSPPPTSRNDRPGAIPVMTVLR
jgi:hypothetical protein